MMSESFLSQMNMTVAKVQEADDFLLRAAEGASNDIKPFIAQARENLQMSVQLLARICHTSSGPNPEEPSSGVAADMWQQRYHEVAAEADNLRAQLLALRGKRERGYGEANPHDMGVGRASFPHTMQDIDVATTLATNLSVHSAAANAADSSMYGDLSDPQAKKQRITKTPPVWSADEVNKLLHAVRNHRKKRGDKMIVQWDDLMQQYDFGAHRTKKSLCRKWRRMIEDQDLVCEHCLTWKADCTCPPAPPQPAPEQHSMENQVAEVSNQILSEDGVVVSAAADSDAGMYATVVSASNSDPAIISHATASV